MRQLCRLFLIGFLVGSMAFPAGLVAQEPSSKTAKPDFRFITPNSTLVAIAHPGRLLSSGHRDMLPHEVITAFGIRDLGFDPMNIETVTMVVEAPDGGPIPNYAVVLQMAKKIEQETLFSGIGLEFEEELDEATGLKLMISDAPSAPTYSVVDEKTLVIANLEMFDTLLKTMKQEESPARDAIVKQYQGHDVQAFLQVEPVRDLVKIQLQQLELPPIGGIDRVPDELDMLSVQFSMLNKAELSVELVGKDEAAAKHLKHLLNVGLDMGEQLAMMEINKLLRSEDVVEQAMGKYQTRVTQKMIQALRPKQEGNIVRIAYEDEGAGQQLGAVAVIGILVALLLPAVQSARSAARNAQGRNNFKQLAIAMHNHHDIYRAFPARAITDEEGKPLLSWRVSLLPLLGHNGLYEQFKLDEPWDSDHNMKLVEKMPAVFNNPANESEFGYTQYVAPVAKGTIWDGDKGKRFRDIIDGSSNTVMFVQADFASAVIWTQPEDLKIDYDNPHIDLDKSDPKGLMVSFADGSVRFVPANLDKTTLKHLLQMNDGQVIRGF